MTGADSAILAGVSAALLSSTVQAFNGWRMRRVDTGANTARLISALSDALAAQTQELQRQVAEIGALRRANQHQETQIAQLMSRLHVREE